MALRGVSWRGATVPDCVATVAGVSVVDDYGHHPTEIAAVLRTAREGAPGSVGGRRSSRTGIHGRGICSPNLDRRWVSPMWSY